MWRATLVGLLAVAALAPGCGAVGDAGSPHALLSFEPRDGWFTAERKEQPDGRVPALAVAWAANVPFVDASHESTWPDPTIRALPPDGIVLEAVGPWTYTGDEDVPTARLPLTLDDGYCLADGYEGQPAPNVSFCAISTRVGGEIMNAYAYFGTNEPPAELRAAANAMLAGLVISP